MAFWERSEKPPRSDVLPKMAQALGVTVEDLLLVGDEKLLKKKAAKNNGRPAGKVREVFDRVQSFRAASRSISLIGSLPTFRITSTLERASHFLKSDHTHPPWSKSFHRGL